MIDRICHIDNELDDSIFLFGARQTGKSTKEKGTLIIIDEIPEVPELLNEVHRLMSEKGLVFILCGSSARKLKRKMSA